jgi:hypothetical protein
MADAAGDVEGAVGIGGVGVIEAGVVFFVLYGEDQRAVTGQADLAAMGVAGEHEIKAVVRRREEVIVAIRVVAEKDDSGIGGGFGEDAGIEVVVPEVIDAGEAELAGLGSVRIGEVQRVAKHTDAGFFEVLTDGGGIGGIVAIVVVAGAAEGLDIFVNGWSVLARTPRSANL